MKTMPMYFNQDGWKPADDDKDKSIQDIVRLVIQSVVYAYSAQRQGLTESERRTWYKASDALDEAVKKGAEQVEFEDEHFGFIRKCFLEVKLSPSTLARRIEELVMGVEYR